MFNVRDEPRPPMPNHFKYLTRKFRPPVPEIRRAPCSPNQAELFRYFQEEREYAKLAALARNPYHGEVMTDAEALEVLSTNESKGFPHEGMMKVESLIFRQGLLDISCIGAFLSLPLAGMVPYLVIAVKRGCDDDWRRHALKKSVKEITIVGNYLDPQAPYPSHNWTYHAEQPLSEETSGDEELEKPGALHIMNSYPLVPSEGRKDTGMLDMPIMTHGIKFVPQC